MLQAPLTILGSILYQNLYFEHDQVEYMFDREIKNTSVNDYQHLCLQEQEIIEDKVSRKHINPNFRSILIVFIPS